MKFQSLFAIVLASMLFALASCENPSVKDMQDRINELEDRLAAVESGGSQNSGSNPSQNDPSGNNPSGTTPSGNQSGATVSGSVGGHDYVDLGLPSGTLWATCNVGADSPEEYGDYFAWGETQPKSSYTWDNLKYCTSFDSNTYEGVFSKYNESDGKTVLEASDDAATVNWGENWRMPNHDEFGELLDGCIAFWTTQQGVKGRLFVGLNGNKLFLPVAGAFVGTSLVSSYDDLFYGCYWTSSTIYDDRRYDMYCFEFTPDNLYMSASYRYEGLSVRPVVK